MYVVHVLLNAVHVLLCCMLCMWCARMVWVLPVSVSSVGSHDMMADKPNVPTYSKLCATILFFIVDFSI